MTARIPYMSGLTRQVSRTECLQPPRPLFIGDSSTPAGAAVRDPNSRDPGAGMVQARQTAARGWSGPSGTGTAPADWMAAQFEPPDGAAAVSAQDAGQGR